MQQREMDLWHFVCDDVTGQWTWRRVSPNGDDVATSMYAFASFTVCVADAERAGFDANVTVVRRMRSADLALETPRPHVERRRRPRDPQSM